MNIYFSLAENFRVRPCVIGNKGFEYIIVIFFNIMINITKFRIEWNSRKNMLHFILILYTN